MHFRVWVYTRSFRFFASLCRSSFDNRSGSNSATTFLIKIKCKDYAYGTSQLTGVEKGYISLTTVIIVSFRGFTVTALVTSLAAIVFDDGVNMRRHGTNFLKVDPYLHQSDVGFYENGQF